jgi:hypothetical protein
VALSVPNVVLWHTCAQRPGVVLQLVLLVALAYVIARWVDFETAAKEERKRLTPRSNGRSTTCAGSVATCARRCSPIAAWCTRSTGSSATRTAGRLGLLGIRERAKLAGAFVSITSRAQAGTRVAVRLRPTPLGAA